MNPRLTRYYTFIKPLIRNKSVKTYSSLVFSLITTLLFTFFALKPTVSTILVLQKQLSEQESVLKDLDTKVQNLSLGKTNLDKVNSDTKQKLNNLIPDKTDPAGLAASLNDLAVSNNASVSGLQFQPTQLIGESKQLNKKPALKTVEFTLNVTGSFDSISNMLKALNNSPRMVTVENMTINQSADSNLIMTLNAKAYYLQN